MPGQFSNFMKNFGKAMFSNVVLPLYDTASSISEYVDPTTMSSVLAPLGGLGTGFNIYWNLNKLDDPGASVRDKTQDVIKAAIAPTSLIPVVGPVVNALGNLVVDGAGYIQDVIEGKKDPPAKGEDIHGKDPVANMGSTIFNSTPFKNFFTNFGKV
jgi:hypothetical protein